MLKFIVLPMYLIALFSNLEMSHAEDWQTFRGPLGDGSSRLENLPTEWGVDKNVTWVRELPGEGWSSPVTVGNTVVVTAAVPQDEELVDTKYDLVAMALDLETGNINFHSPFGDPLGLNRYRSHDRGLRMQER